MTRKRDEDQKATPSEVMQHIPTALALMRAKHDAGLLVEELLSHQKPPVGDDWLTWVLQAGRGAGKTYAGSHYCIDELRERGQHARVHVVAPTWRDVRETCFEGESGLLTLYEHEIDKYNRSALKIFHRDGGIVLGFSADEPGRLRGPQCSRLWGDEGALWPWEAWQNARFGLRLGPLPRALLTTTPRNRRLMREILAEPDTVVTRAATKDNPYLPQRIVDSLYRSYSGTRLGRQELDGELLQDIEGALWDSEWIDDSRITRDQLPELERIIIAIDPATSTSARSAQTGIAAVGRSVEGDYYVLDVTGNFDKPKVWAERAVTMYKMWRADLIVGEVNNGGDMVESTIEQYDRNVPFRMVHASRGKRVRAEPISLLYQKGRVHHVGHFLEAEEQLTSFTGANTKELKDQLDAIVWAITELLEDSTPLLFGRIGHGIIPT